MTIADLKRFTEDEARELFEAVLWPDGPVCMKCGNCDQNRIARMKPNKGARIREGLRRCMDCRTTFRVQNGTILEGSHLPLSTWLFIVSAMASSKKGISAKQLQRELKAMHPNGDYGNYRNIWHACHRIRHAMEQHGMSELLGGAGRVVEADTTWFGAKPRYPGQVKDKTIVLTLVERGGRSFSKVIRREDAETFRANLLKYVDTRSKLMTDNHKGFVMPGKQFASHETTAHTLKEYARGDVHSNTAENWFSAAKLSFRATHHGYSDAHAFRYLAERDHAYNTRHLSDVERVRYTIQRMAGKRLFYKAPKNAPRPAGDYLVGESDQTPATPQA